jgi:hypothetical protein
MGTPNPGRTPCADVVTAGRTRYHRVPDEVVVVVDRPLALRCRLAAASEESLLIHWLAGSRVPSTTTGVDLISDNHTRGPAGRAEMVCLALRGTRPDLIRPVVPDNDDRVDDGAPQAFSDCCEDSPIVRAACRCTLSVV